MKTYSVGLVVCDTKKILGCLPWGRKDKKLDIPKGSAEPYEPLWDTLVREVFEETGLNILQESISYLGEFDYLPQKNLYLYLWRPNSLPPIDEMKCTSVFTNNFGVPVPEIIGYKYVKWEELNQFFPPLQPILKYIYIQWILEDKKL